MNASSNPSPNSISVWATVLLLFFAVVSTAFMTYALSIHQLRLRAQAYTIAKQPMSIYQLRRFARLSDAQNELANKLRELDERRKQMMAQMAPLVTDIVALGTMYSVTEATLVARLKQQGAYKELPPFAENKPKLIAERVAVLRELCQPGTTCQGLDESWDSLNKVVLDLARKNTDFGYLEHQLKSGDLERNEIDSRLKNAESELNKKLFGTATVTEDQRLERDRAEMIWSEFTALDHFFLHRYLDVSSAPQELLTIILALAGGFLGCAAQQLSSSVYRTEANTPGISALGYAFSPLYGALVALILFIIVRAGVLIATDPSARGQTGAELNPFLVSFLGIVAGLITEQVIIRARSIATSWLGTADIDRPRWALNIDKVMNAAGLTVTGLAEWLGEPVAKIQSWVDGGAPVPADKQRLIAAWLKLPLREVFSDLPPMSPPPRP